MPHLKNETKKNYDFSFDPSSVWQKQSMNASSRWPPTELSLRVTCSRHKATMSGPKPPTATCAATSRGANRLPQPTSAAM